MREREGERVREREGERVRGCYGDSEKQQGIGQMRTISMSDPSFELVLATFCCNNSNSPSDMVKPLSSFPLSPLSTFSLTSILQNVIYVELCFFQYKLKIVRKKSTVASGVVFAKIASAAQLEAVLIRNTSTS